MWSCLAMELLHLFVVRLQSLTTVLLFCSSSRLLRSLSREAQACGMNNPDAKAITHLVLTFPEQMQAASWSSVDPYTALHLYQQIKDLPGTETCVNMVEEGHISINGPHLPSHPHIVTAVDLDSGSLLALKLLPPRSQEQKDVAQREKRAVSLLQLDTAWIPLDHSRFL